MITMIVWVILKIAGVINTPPLLESVPTIGTIFAAGAFYQKMSDVDKRLIRVETKAEKIETNVHILDKRLSIVENGIGKGPFNSRT
ncbi:hypothetical protein HYU19_03540 [Candidatus Woesearchaeota archaeon]|nr:hypothetical protein [Candidatus Woesearchaeota archaeon]